MPSTAESIPLFDKSAPALPIVLPVIAPTPMYCKDLEKSPVAAPIANPATPPTVAPMALGTLAPSALAPLNALPIFLAPFIPILFLNFLPHLSCFLGVLLLFCCLIVGVFPGSRPCIF